MNNYSSKDERWWEFYLVRYFVGTVFGVLIVYFLNTDHGSPLCGKLFANLQEKKDLNFIYSVILASSGFAFCYIASAPILVFHALRGNFQNIINGKMKRLGVGCCFILSLVFTFILFLCLFGFDKINFSLVVFSLILALQLFLYCYSLFLKGNVFGYYRTLARERSNRKYDTVYSEYIESYKHLREHGNAFFILVLESLLAWILYNSENVKHSIYIVLLWIVPAFLVWFVGVYLEFSLKKLRDNF